MPLTLADARTLLSDYVGQGLNFTTRLNLATERLVKNGNWSGTKQRVNFNVFPDTNNQAVVTLPRAFNTILAGAVMSSLSDGVTYGRPLPVRNGWYGLSSAGPGIVNDSRYRWQEGFVPEEGRFTTFRDWTTAVQLRLKFSTTETNPTNFYIRGNLNGQPVYSGSGSSTIEGIKLVYTAPGTITSAESFDEPPYEFIKPITNGTVSLYTWDGVTETLVAIYSPEETNPGWRRYRVPACSSWNEADPGQMLTVCKIAWQPISNDNDEVLPGNIGAIRMALEALQNEDSEDYVRAQAKWQIAYQLLASEVEDDTGAGADGVVQVMDTFQMCNVGGMT